MKKNLFLFAAAALALTACTSDDDLVQTGQKVTQSESRALVFDTYTAGTTRAGEPEGVMTTDKLKTENKGFGVFAFHHDNVTTTPNYPANNTSLFPNFMYNEHISWATAGGWTYSPLKYWPNETQIDSQDEPAVSPEVESRKRLDRLSFFAYAPYVATGSDPLNTKDATTMITDRTPSDEATWTKVSAYHGSEKYGITAISADELASDPLVEWGCLTARTGDVNNQWDKILDHNVDLLWGVAPAGMAYQSVNPTKGVGEVGYVSKTAGLPLTDMLKPDKDLKMKFLFQHALSRIGLNVVSAIDQIAAGDDGGKFNNEQTRVLIEDVIVWGNFGVKGVLNLCNTSVNTANWIWNSVDRNPSTETMPILKVNATNGYLANGLRYDATTIDKIRGTVGTAGDGSPAFFSDLNLGVLPSEQVLCNLGPDPSITKDNPAFKFGTIYYTVDGSGNYSIATTTPSVTDALFTKTGNNDAFTQVRKESADFEMNGTSPNLYKLTISSAIDHSSLVEGTTYYVLKSGSVAGGNAVFGDKFEQPATGGPTSGEFYTIEPVLLNEGTEVNAYSGTLYTGSSPRYFMVIPTALTPEGTKTDVYVKIKYHVITKDDKLTDYISDVENEITKKISVSFECGKSYNLKLILGLTSVKLDATVGEWQVGDDAEVWLPQNVE